MDRFAELTGRSYHLFDYVGAPDAERVVILMGSAIETAHETVDHLTAKGEKVGVLKVRLYRPFDASRFVAALPRTVKSIAVLDRTKEPGAGGEPLYKDVICASPRRSRTGPSTGCRASSAAATACPPRSSPRRWSRRSSTSSPRTRRRTTSPSASRTTSTAASLEVDATFTTEPDDVVRAMFYGLGSDGTVGANKNSIKIIGEETDNFARATSCTTRRRPAPSPSHLRFGPRRSARPT
jgi:pyruvate-ferredoxin/flavodoxin oxidoreductase